MRKYILFGLFVLIISACIPLASTHADDYLKFWWKFDEGTGTIANDSSGNIPSYPGTLNNGPTWIDGGASSTVVGFYYGLTTSYGSTMSTSGTYGNDPFNETLTGLQPGKTYHYKAFAENTAGTGTSGDQEFTTASVSDTTQPARSGSSSSYSVGVGTSGLARGSNSNSATSGRFLQNLSSGMGNNDVWALQRFLNAHGFIVAPAGPGSPGNEMTIFGRATRAALVKFQRANNIAPAIGFFGPITRGVVNRSQ